MKSAKSAEGPRMRAGSMLCERCGNERSEHGCLAQGFGNLTYALKFKSFCVAAFGMRLDVDSGRLTSLYCGPLGILEYDRYSTRESKDF